MDSSTEKPKLSRRDFLKFATAGTGAFLVSNSLLGEYIYNLEPNIGQVKDKLSDYKIAWQARPWVWTNLAIASDKIDGTRINPGEEMSLIKLLGFDAMKNVSRENTDPRSGYVAAQMSDPSKLDGWGYGLCLASTSIFRAALDSPLLIPKRGTHYDIYPDYFKDMPIGTDAAVYQPDPGDSLPETDLLLTNPTNEPLTLFFRIYNEFGERLTPPESEISLGIYKATYLEHLVRVLRQKLNSETGIELPKQYIPEYVFGNKKIIVQAAISGENINYSTRLSPVKHGDSTVMKGVTQYVFDRYLAINIGESNEKKYTETFVSQYQ